MKLMVTGGAGFIGSAVIRRAIRETQAEIVNIDKLTYAAMPEALEGAAESPRYAFERIDICDRAALDAAFARHAPDAVLHLAAESHVDRSIDAPGAFIETNLVGTFQLLQAARAHLERLSGAARERFRFLHVSTDEVFGALGPEDPPFDEETPYRPSSPYSASKAGADHLVRAWAETFGLPVLTTNCSNNYGPWQFPEKLIPVLAARAADGREMPIYGRGENVRDWLHVEDHAAALLTVLERAPVGGRYAIGGRAERRNLAVAEAVCAAMDRLRPEGAPHARLITFVEDRPGHDLRYAIDASRIERELGWRPARRFDEGLEDTVRWYLSHEDWWRAKIAARAEVGERMGRGATAR